MAWTLSELTTALGKHEGWSVDTSKCADSLVLTNEDGIDAYVAVAGEQIIVEVVLFSQKNVNDTSALNSLILRTHKMFPLSTIGINTISDEDYYVAFGSLSSQSKEESVVIEVATLYRNVEAFIELYDEYLGVSA
ncbi:DUF2170 family protein [Vibrio genomosp. F10]|uniref:DUF2170 family protein n=1 Tax=Vibrio genomosp. F10 TaxID=723171 RepID=UPI0002D58048|nr:DUF2170 family protein [Vibrio genomosp. F10]OEF08749.1 cytoplasmic protein [Vibrio genomosp. F10 str. 9ZD137]